MATPGKGQGPAAAGPTSSRGTPPSDRKAWGFLSKKDSPTAAAPPLRLQPTRPSWQANDAEVPGTGGGESKAEVFEGAAVPLVLAGVSLAYLWAFASLWLQIPGLWGDEGVLPADTIILRDAPKFASGRLTQWELVEEMSRFPSLAALGPTLGVHTTTVLECLALLGVTLSALAAALPCWRVGPVFAALHVAYRSFTLVGGTFMHFQWDTLLLETGALAAFAAPLWSVGGRTEPTGEVSRWLFRWLAFKLMFQSGVVKLTSECPTWWGLTALTIHYESQCIPTPLAFYFHHLPRWFHELSVLVTFLFEIPFPFLFLFKLAPFDLVGFVAQCLLMGMIVLTGNYNFFNVLTVVLSVALLSDRGLAVLRGGNGGGARAARRRTWWAACAVAAAVTAASAAVAVNVEPGPRFSLSFNLEQFRPWIERGLVAGLVLGAASLAWAAGTDAAAAARSACGGGRRSLRMVGTAVRTAAAVGYLLANVVALTRVDDRGRAIQQVQSVASGAVWRHALVVHHYASRHEAANSYGLFRRMTGVDARPEVVIEGSADGKVWREFSFKYKPGDVWRRPAVVAPHQPRLDWQMWFAALGSIRHNGWLATLAARLLQGSEPALRLLGPGQPFSSNRPPKHVRAQLYAYHFAPAPPLLLGGASNGSGAAVEPGCYASPDTRHPDASCRCHPRCAACGYGKSPTGEADCVSCAGGAGGHRALHAVYSDGTGECVDVESGDGRRAWWTRVRKQEYLQPVSLDDDALKSFLDDLGFGRIKPRTRSVCAASPACRAVTAVRSWLEAPLEAWFVPVTLCVVWALRLAGRAFAAGAGAGGRGSSAGAPRKEKQS